ncbi:hypothetical protein HK101_000502 [Irineochytrium annulatum]|nr:hypothetical protein HK101_000502 [Irineochytrium annulatum]
MARDYIVDQEKFELLAGYFSPVSSSYEKEGLAAYTHRVAMCQKAVEDSDWIMVDGWEASQPEYIRTAPVLQHFDTEINDRRDVKDAVGPNGGVVVDGKRRPIRIMLLAGGDLIESFAKVTEVNGRKAPVWAPEDLDIILGCFGCVIIERKDADVFEFLLKYKKLHEHRLNVN